MLTYSLVEKNSPEKLFLRILKENRVFLKFFKNVKQEIEINPSVYYELRKNFLNGDWHEGNILPRNDSDRTLFDSMSRAIMNAFNWSLTQQSSVFWCKMHLDIGEGRYITKSDRLVFKKYVDLKNLLNVKPV